ncbi:ATP-grasp domain-containing protein [Methylophilus sp.]|uniref:ATP-grasp domain-containing protein n=1 Tax=Methylophilus sp. TaxID=29541 RepID=UPI0011D37EB8|nr:ATP-grasp domain-containing protein [Methylophilus sp.]TXI46810.1 MAG: ATP-grasp domain-containing protein [Methylophilus sp.]
MKRIMIIAGGEWQIPVIRKAKQLGLFVINTNLHPQSLGFNDADVGLVADVLDKEQNLAYAKEWNVDAVITDQSDIAVPTVAYVAEHMQLKGVGTAVAALFTNKSLMRSFCVKHGFPSPRFKLCNELKDGIAFLNECNFPLVVKPPANQSSRGVLKVTNMHELEHAYTLAMQHSKDETVLIEEFIGGVELTIDGVQLNAGEHYSLATSTKTHYAHNEMIANQLWFSQQHPEIDFDALHDQHNQMVKLMGLPFGLTHAEYKYHAGKFYLVEIAARGGGTKISSDIVPLMSGIDSNNLLIRMALGERIHEIHPEARKITSVLDFFEFSPGKVKTIHGIEQASVLSGVISIGLNIVEGDIIEEVSDDRSRHGYIIAYAENTESLKGLLRKIHQTVQITYE